MAAKGINIVAAVASNGAIGRANSLIWHLGEDLKFFKNLTMGCPVIMGRKCYDSIGRPLPGRKNIVISRGNPAVGDGILVVHSLEEALQAVPKPEKCFIIGGGQIYAQAMDIADTLYITKVYTNPTDADVFFPEINPKDWELEQTSQILKDERENLEFRFEKYSRK